MFFRVAALSVALLAVSCAPDNPGACFYSCKKETFPASGGFSAGCISTASITGTEACDAYVADVTCKGGTEVKKEFVAGCDCNTSSCKPVW